MLKSKPLRMKYTKKEDFINLLDRAISSPPVRGKQVKSDDYSGKKTRQHTSASASAKQRGKSSLKTS